jgi:hypothetical protein
MDKILKDLAKIGQKIQEEREENLLTEMIYIEGSFFEDLQHSFKRKNENFRHKFSHNKFKPVENKCFGFLSKLKYHFIFSKHLEQNHFDKSLLHTMFESYNPSRMDYIKMNKDLHQFLITARARYSRC